MNSRRMGTQGGAALVVGLIMLVLITLMLISALNLSTSNFRAVSNMQFREEAVAAANQAIETVISNNDFTGTPTADVILVDVNDDGVDDYSVAIAPPVCMSATQANAPVYSDESLGPTMSVTSNWNTVWEVDATVSGAQNVGAAAVRVHAGVRALLSQAQKNAVCL